MSDKTAIEWTDTTWNPVRGCTKVSPGCAHCYAETFAERWRGVPGHAYEQGFDLRLVPEKLDEPLRWKKPRRVFVNSMSDLFQDGVPDAFIDRVFAVMALAPQHTFQMLTKRAERMRQYVCARTAGDRLHTDIAREVQKNVSALNAAERWHATEGVDGFIRWPLRNVWLGVSVENQHFLERIDALKDTPAAVHFVSFEPLLEDLGAVIFDGIEWGIIGFESGAGARSGQVAWARSLVRQFEAAGVPKFVKQLGVHVIDRNDAGFEGDTPTSWPMDTNVQHDPNGFREKYQGAPVRVRLYARKGGNPLEWPEDLRVREFPAVRQ